MATTIRPLDTLLAQKVIGLLTTLSRSHKAIASSLIDHYNRRDARCDPGIARLAALAGVHQRTVFRALNRLEELDLVRRVRHAGRGATNSYEPNWEKLRSIDQEWRQRFNGSKRRATTRLSLPSGHSCQRSPDSTGVQTDSINTSLKTCSKGSPASASAARSRPTRPAPSSAQAARDAAERRWARAFHEHYKESQQLYALMLDAITQNIRDDVTQAEFTRPGSGLAFIIDKVEPEVAAREYGAACHGSFQTVSPARILDREDAPFEEDSESLKRTKK